MIVLLGRSCSGKSTVAKEFEKLGFEKIVTYTTRPPREGEIDGIDYYFISETKFLKMVRDGEFAETSVYRGWYYGSLIKDYYENSYFGNKPKIIVLTPKGLRMIKNNHNMKNIPNFYSVFLDVSPTETLIKSILTRSDIDECYRRYISDNGMFDGVKDEVDFVIENFQYQYSPSNVVQIILDKIQERSKRQKVKEIIHEDLL